VNHAGKPESSSRVIIIGGGPAGLTAAYEIQRLSSSHQPLVFEADELVGGIARTEQYKGYRFDIGGHRFFTKIPEVEEMWRSILGSDLLTVQRSSRIFYNGKFYDYPLRVLNALGNLGPYESVRILLSYLKWRVKPHTREENFPEWVMNRFGGRLYMHFFQSYTEKVWGIPAAQIRADWAAQRIQNLSLSKAVWNALSGANDTSSLIEQFEYPRLGPGMMWEKTAQLIEHRGGTISTNTSVAKVLRDESRITGIEIFSDESQANGGGREQVVGNHYINTMPLRDLIHSFDPPPPSEVIDAAESLRYRDFIIVALILDHPDPFPDNWIYVHSDVRVGRIQNFRAWSADMLPDASTSCIGMEYFCAMDDDLWGMADEALIRLASGELGTLGLAGPEDVADAKVIRQPKAYPVYDGDYQKALHVIKPWLESLENLQTIGRNGLHRYNNQDHSMLTAMYAARNILGEQHDVWNVNVERSYHEKFELGGTDGESAFATPSAGPKLSTTG
jgi:protoporphyrinogen oxidase